MQYQQTLTGLLLLVVLTLPAGAAISSPPGQIGDFRAFIADDPDPDAGRLPPFVYRDLDAVIRAAGVTPANVSSMRDFAYATTQPPHRVGSDEITLAEYRSQQLRSIRRNDSTSLWVSDSNRTNGTFVTDAHITILGTEDGVYTRLPTGVGPNRTNRSTAILPRNGTVFTYLDYATRVPNRTCTVENSTKICVSFRLVEQNVEREVRIGSQTWANESSSARQLSYSGANATAPTTLEVRGTINTTVAVQTTTYARKGESWKVVGQHDRGPRTYSHTVRDTSRAVVSTNQQLHVTQTFVRSSSGPDRLVLRFRGPEKLEHRRLWSQAALANNTGVLQNGWRIYSQRRYETATRGHRTSGGPNVSSNVANLTTTLPNASDSTVRLGSTAQSDGPPGSLRQQSVASPNVLEKRLFAQSSKPTLQVNQSASIIDRPEIARVEGSPLADRAAPLSPRVNLSSVQPRATSTVVLTGVSAPIVSVKDIHNDSIPMSTRTVTERNTTLSSRVVNDTHARVRLTQADSGDPLENRTLWLNGAAEPRVTTDGQGVAIIERRDLYVTVSFPGVTDVSQDAYYGAARARIAFHPEPFSIYQLISSLAGAFVSVAAFVVFYAPFAYLRDTSGGRS